MPRRSNRREFLKHTSAATVGFWIATRPTNVFGKSANEKLNIAGVGVGGQGGGDIGAVSGENIVALCDVDEEQAGGTFKKFPSVPKFHDYRVMLDKMHKEIDAVVVATPDHMHAPVSLAAMQLGKHVYCEKPLTHTVHEAREMAKAAEKYKVVTQMGNQGHSNNGSRRSVEIIRSGLLGTIKEVHCWTDRPGGWWPQGIDRPEETPPVRRTLKWDLWLGVAPKRPYHPAYLPFKWRGWWDFGTGAMGDMACHVCDIAFWSLDLKNPTAIECKTSGQHAETGPLWEEIVWEFPARGDLPPVKLFWYDGGRKPAAALVGGGELPSNGSIFVGEKGTLFSPGSYGEKYFLLPEDKWKGAKLPDKSIPDANGHHAEWIKACKRGDRAKEMLSHFGYAGAMTEVLLLGNLSVRTGRRIEWDAEEMKVTNLPQANQYVNPPYRTGW